MMRLIAIALLTFGLCACTTFALIGHVEYQREDSQGRLRSEHIVGLLALPTPGGNTVVFFPLYKSSRLATRVPMLPSSAQRWMTEQTAPPGPAAP